MINLLHDVRLFGKEGEYDAVLLQSNVYNTISGTYQALLKDEYPFIRVDMMTLPYGDQRRLGTVLITKREDTPTFIFAIVSKNNGKKELAERMYSYESLEKCLKTVNRKYSGKRIASQLFGPNQEPETVEKIMEIFKKQLTNVDVDIYDYVEPTYMERLEAQQKLKEENFEEYQKVMKEVYERQRRIKKNRIIWGNFSCKYVN